MKIFGIGLSRTGTLSLNQALNLLGIRSIHWPIDNQTIRYLQEGNANLPILEDFDAITDIVTVPFYKLFDRQFPGSKFILTVREKEAWLNSVKRHLSRLSLSQARNKSESFYIKCAVYGCGMFSRDQFSDVYDAHLREVSYYFSDRPESLLVININAGEGWQELCSFLNLPVPQLTFPHENHS